MNGRDLALAVTVCSAKPVQERLSHLTLASVFSSSIIFPRTFGTYLGSQGLTFHPTTTTTTTKSSSTHRPVVLTKAPCQHQPSPANYPSSHCHALCPVHKSETTASFAGHERRGSESSLTTEKLRTRSSQDGTRYFYPIRSPRCLFPGKARETPPPWGPQRSHG